MLFRIRPFQGCGRTTSVEKGAQNRIRRDKRRQPFACFELGGKAETGKISSTLRSKEMGKASLPPPGDRRHRTGASLAVAELQSWALNAL
jgi:hypothetical protein